MTERAAAGGIWDLAASMAASYCPLSLHSPRLARCFVLLDWFVKRTSESRLLPRAKHPPGSY